MPLWAPGQYTNSIRTYLNKRLLPELSERLDAPIEDMVMRVKHENHDGFSVVVRTNNIMQAKHISFYMTPLPGNCAVLVSHNTYFNESAKGKGIGTLLQDIKEEIAANFNFSMLMGSDAFDPDLEISKRKPQYHIFKNNNWEPSFSITNKRTGNFNSFWIKKVEVKPNFNMETSEFI